LKFNFSDFSRGLLGYFFRGILFISPIVITVYAIVSIVSFLDSLIPGLYPGLSVIAIIVGITLIGMAISAYFITAPDTMEAVIGAVFFDAGYVEARHFVKKIFAKELKLATPDSSADFKTLLQEHLQALKLGTPIYRVTQTEGLPHERKFSVEAVWENGSSAGEGTSIKAAEMMAARHALEELDGKASNPQPKKASRRIAKEKNEHI